jgi:hypothetical protein
VSAQLSRCLLSLPSLLSLALHLQVCPPGRDAAPELKSPREEQLATALARAETQAAADAALSSTALRSPDAVAHSAVEPPPPAAAAIAPAQSVRGGVLASPLLFALPTFSSPTHPAPLALPQGHPERIDR